MNKNRIKYYIGFINIKNKLFRTLSNFNLRLVINNIANEIE